MIRWFKSLFAWRAVRNSGVWVYCENTVTGQRKAHQVAHGYQPLDREFLRDGDLVVSVRGNYIIGTESEIWAR